MEPDDTAAPSARPIGQDHGMESIELDADGLLLRAWRPEDADAVHRACQDPLIQRWTAVPVPYERGHAEGFVGPYSEKAWSDATAAPLGVFDAGTGELLGSCGLVRLDLAGRVGDVDLWVAPWARGRRVAERAARAVALWGLEVLRLRQLTWQTPVGNHAAKLVAERVGFRFDGVQRGFLYLRDGEPVDGWRGVLHPGQIPRQPSAWLARGGPAALRTASFGAPQPTLPTRVAGVTLRRPAERDIDDLVETSRDPETIRWTGITVPYGPADAARLITERGWARWNAATAATFTIADPDDRFAGIVDLGIDQTDPAIAEIGFMVAPWVRGRGYASAAAQAICHWGFTSLALSRIVWRAHLGNLASRQVATAVGFVQEGIQRLGCQQRGTRLDGWVASLLAADLALPDPLVAGSGTPVQVPPGAAAVVPGGVVPGGVVPAGS